MSQTLFTNVDKPLSNNFKQEFKTNLTNSNELVIASGYFGASSIVDYESDILNLGSIGVCKILIGMIYHGGVTQKQKDLLISLDTKLRAINPDNGVYISIKDYHGKIYLFRNKSSNLDSVYIGSSNFSEEGFATRHECTALIQHEKTKKDVIDYLKDLFDSNIALPLNKVDLKVKGLTAYIVPASKLLEDYEIPFAEFPDLSAPIGICDIELRVDDQPNSSLNLFFDKGRKNPITNLYAPRPWYEVEVTSCAQDRKSPYYPKSKPISAISSSRNGEFVAYSEDNGKYYKFQMVVCSDNGKAIQTHKNSGGRATLGKFIKGKLERAGLLKEGERITSDTLIEYGNSYLRFIKISEGVYVIHF